MKGCFFLRKPPPDVNFLLKVLDCSDVIELAEMYGEARDGFKSQTLMQAVNDRMAEVMRAASAIDELHGPRCR